MAREKKEMDRIIAIVPKIIDEEKCVYEIPFTHKDSSHPGSYWQTALMLSLSEIDGVRSIDISGSDIIVYKSRYATWDDLNKEIVKKILLFSLIDTDSGRVSSDVHREITRIINREPYEERDKGLIEGFRGMRKEMEKLLDELLK